MIAVPRGDDETALPSGRPVGLTGVQGAPTPQLPFESAKREGSGETPPASPRGTHLPSLFLSLLSGLGLVTGLLAAGILELLHWSRLTRGANLGVYAWTAGLVAMINLAALVYSAPRALGRTAPAWRVPNGWTLATIAMGLWVLDLAAANQLVGRSTVVSELLLPPLTILAVAIPLWWLIELGRRGLRTTPQRAWGAASASLVATAPMVILVELVTFVILGLIILVWLSGTSPDLIRQLQNSLNNGLVGYEALIDMLQPYLQRPGVILAGLMVLTVLTPLIEESLKPLALWFIPGWRLGEAEGFNLGLVAGGIFALLETLGSLSAAGEKGELWLVLVLVRAGTGLLHITCSGLVGWGLAAAWSRARYLQLAGLYLLAAFIHGAWNLFAQFMSLSELLPGNPLTGFLGRAAPFVMAVLAVTILSLLIRVNRYLVKQQTASSPPASIPHETPPAPAQPDSSGQ